MQQSSHHSSIREFYRGKIIFMTGITGFVGKVLLEKLLWCNPEIQKIYILIRGKKGSINKRFKKEVLDSPCFDRLRKRHNDNFHNFALNICIPVQGDLTLPKLGIAPQIYLEITESVDVLINVAASVKFNDRIDVAIHINVDGTLKVLQLAKDSKHLLTFVHVSTAYVNSNQTGYVKEEIYEQQIEPQQLINAINLLTPEQATKQEKTIIKGFPNTYTYSKCISERMLYRYKGVLPIAVQRPTIIVSAERDPQPGWVDSISACSAMYLLLSLGIMRAMQGRPLVQLDLVPVDYVVDQLIVIGALQANDLSFKIFHCSSSELNPITIKQASSQAINYFNQNPPSNRVQNSNLSIYKYDWQYRLKMLEYKVPVQLYSWYASFFGRVQDEKRSRLMQKVIAKSEQANDAFVCFTNTNWVFGTQNQQSLVAQIRSQSDKEDYHLDVTRIDWDKTNKDFAYGVLRFLLKEEVAPPSDVSRSNILYKGVYDAEDADQTLDYKWALTHGQAFVPPDFTTLMAKVLNNASVIKEISKMKDGQKRAEVICKETFSQYNFKLMRFLSFFFHKFLKKVYRQIVVDENQITLLKKLEKTGPLVLVSNRISYIDFMIQSYVLYANGIKCPFVNANHDFMRISLVSQLLRSTGTFFTPSCKEAQRDPLFCEIIAAYLKELVACSANFGLYLEDHRTRSGKLEKPQNLIFRIFASTFMNGGFNNNHNSLTTQQHQNQQINVIPISIGYDKVLEVDTFPFELLGEAKAKESLRRVLKSVLHIFKNYGRVFVEIGSPIELSSFFQSQTIRSQNQEQMQSQSKDTTRYPKVQELTQLILNQISQISVILPSSIVASVILMHRKGISQDALVQQAHWLGNELVKRGKKIGSVSSQSLTLPVMQTISLMKDQLVQKKNQFSIQYTSKVEYQAYLMLAYYRNALQHVFIGESQIACALASSVASNDKHNNNLISTTKQEGVLQSVLLKDANFLNRLLKREIVSDFSVENDYQRMLQYDTVQRVKVKRNNNTIIKLESESDAQLQQQQQEEDDYMVFPKNQAMLAFLLSLIYPFVENYWICFMYIQFIHRKGKKQGETMKQLIEQIQWYAQLLFEEGVTMYYESCSNHTIKHALAIFKEQGILVPANAKTKKSKKTTTDSSSTTSQSEERKPSQKKTYKINLDDKFAQEMEQTLNRFQSRVKEIPRDIANQIKLDFSFIPNL